MTDTIEKQSTLRQLEPGQTAVISAVGGEGALRQHFLDMGVIPGERISLIKYAPMGDPMELMIHGYELTLRLADAEEIAVTDIRSTADEDISDDALDTVSLPDEGESIPGMNKGETPHPGFGEDHFDQKTDNSPAHEGTLTFALVGNQNCGKTTLFNQLTGSNQHVGNFPGVTVDKKSGAIKGHPDTEVTDLPGIYSLSPYTGEEIVSRKFILEEKPTAIINIVDATNIERNLYLTMQLLELGIPTVLALNMMDELHGNGGSIRINKMEQLLQIPVVPISAAKNEGINELINHAVHVAKYHEKPHRTDFCSKEDHNGAVHRAIHGVMSLIEDHAQRAEIPVRFAASKLIEGDSLVSNALRLSDNETDMIGHIVSQLEEERGLDRAAAIADMRFTFIRRLCARTVVKPRESREHERCRRIDRILTGKWTAIPLFILIMSAVFFLTFNVIGLFFQNLLEQGISALTALVDSALTSSGVAAPLHSLIIGAVFKGVGTVVSFVPIIVVLFFFLSMLEDSGYMARVAFVMDKLLRKIGLSGRSIVPLLVGFGCSVPAAMATRTLPSRRDRRMTTLMIPFMSCSAKMPIYAFFAAAFFPGRAALVNVLLYFGGIVTAIITAYVGKNTVYKGEAVPFVMELPNYRLPGIKNVLRLMWDKAKDFLQRAFTVIFIGTIVVWFLQTFDFRLNMVSDSQDSILAAAAGIIAPVFAPLGLGDWRIVTALISGFMAKESIVSMITVLYGADGITAALTTLQAVVFLTFCLLYTPCIAAVAAIKKERGIKFTSAAVIVQLIIAWTAALIVRFVGMLIFG
ncbi:MAG: ferrous iron transport protein B [Oscillospiraceae bacterium]|nr:ferrous iron transport protein B [Oscillospiraceae bacterium]